MTRRATGVVGATMFLSRWLQAPLYLDLILVQDTEQETLIRPQQCR